MSVKSLSSSSLTNNVFYRSLLVGNDPFTSFTAADDLLEEITLTSSASSVTFSGLGSYSDYASLQIRAVGQVDNVVDGLHHLFIRLNSDTGANYAYHTLYGQGSTVVSSSSAPQSFMLARNVFGSSADADYTGGVVMDFLDYGSSSKTTTMRALGGATQPGESAIGLNSGLWNNTAAVTTILVYLGSGNFTAGSRFSLIGIR